MKAEDLCQELQRLLAADPGALQAILDNRVLWSGPEAYAGRAIFGERDGSLTLGALGILNGLVEGDDRVAAQYDDAAVLVGFSVRGGDWSCPRCRKSPCECSILDDLRGPPDA